MLRRIKDFIKTTPVYDSIKDRRQRKILFLWEMSSAPRIGPLPHIFKRFTIKDYASKFDCRVLIETGTFEGDMIKSCLNFFDRIISIELDGYFFERANRLFKNEGKVRIVHGDSGTKLLEILPTLSEKALFWLDGHYSGGTTAKGSLDTPISLEIEHILNHKIQDHVILIDDARCFDGTNGYPELDSFISEIRRRRNDYSIEVYNDIIRITPSTAVIKK